jgi:hypothetical protein
MARRINRSKQADLKRTAPRLLCDGTGRSICGLRGHASVGRAASSAGGNGNPTFAEGPLILSFGAIPSGCP